MRQFSLHGKKTSEACRSTGSTFINNVDIFPVGRFPVNLYSSAAEETSVSKVWRDMDQAALDAAYDQTIYAPNYRDIVGRMVRNSALLSQRVAAPQTHAYGDTPIERLYYYPAARTRCPIHIHVHGGAWRQRLAKDVVFPAEMFLMAGAGFAICDFISVDETGGDLRPLSEQVLKCVTWVARHAHELGGDAGRIHLSGFSSGAHLASVALTADWRARGFDRTPFKSAALVSGMFDLRPVRLSKRSEYLTFTDEIEDALSPQRHLDKIDIPVLLAYGTQETPEFQRQTREFYDALRAAGKSAELEVCEGYNHYEMMEMLGNPCSQLGRALLAQNLA
jgi:arylformamidase